MQPAASVRPATVQDARGIAEVHVRGWQIGYEGIVPADYLAGMQVDAREVVWRENILKDPTQATLVTVEESRILGFAGYGLNGDGLCEAVGELLVIYVDPDVWSRGIGSALLVASESGLAASGYTSAILWTLAPNHRTRRFYENRGWATDGAAKPHRSDLEIVRYAKPLKAILVDRELGAV